MKFILSILILLAMLSYKPLIAQSQEKAFNLQLNTGYHYMAGNKLSIGSGKLRTGSLNSGQVPIGIEVKYKFINRILHNKKYVERMKNWSNHFTDRLYFNFAYTAFVGIPYTYIQRGNNFEDTYLFNLHTHTLRIGASYDFATDFEQLLQHIFNKPISLKNLRTYAGIDFVLLLQKAHNTYDQILQNKNIANGKISSNLFANFGIMPKLEVEYTLPTTAYQTGNRFAQWWKLHQFYIHTGIQYTLIIPSTITNFPLPEQPTRGKLDHSINFNAGVGFRF